MDWFHRVFLTDCYLRSLSDEKLRILTLCSNRRRYVRESNRREFEKVTRRIRELREQDIRETTRVRLERLFEERMQEMLTARLRLAKQLGEADRRNDELLQQVDDLREERNQLLDICHDYEQALKAVAPKGE